MARAAQGEDSSANAPMLNGDRVWWSVVEFTGDEADPTRTNLYSRDLTAAGPTPLEVPDVGDATLSDNRLVYVAPAKGATGQAEIHRRYLSTGADNVIATVPLGPEEALHSSPRPVTTSPGSSDTTTGTPGPPRR